MNSQSQRYVLFTDGQIGRRNECRRPADYVLSPMVWRWSLEIVEVGVLMIEREAQRNAGARKKDDLVGLAPRTIPIGPRWAGKSGIQFLLERVKSIDCSWVKTCT